MAAPKKKATAKASPKAANLTLIDPFKVKKAATPKTSKLDVVDPQDDQVKKAVDEFIEISGEIKNLEGQLAGPKEMLNQYGQTQFAQRQFSGRTGNFRILGENTSCQYQVQERSRHLDDDALDQFAETYSDNGRNLFETDLGSVRFNADFLKQDGVYEKLIKALQPLGPEFLQELLIPAGYKVTKGSITNAAKLAETEDQLAEMYRDMKLTAFVRS